MPTGAKKILKFKVSGFCREGKEDTEILSKKPRFLDKSPNLVALYEKRKITFLSNQVEATFCTSKRPGGGLLHFGCLLSFFSASLAWEI